MTQAERDTLNAGQARFYQQIPRFPAVPLTAAQFAYNARTNKLKPNGQASRDRLIAARLRVRGNCQED